MTKPEESPGTIEVQYDQPEGDDGDPPSPREVKRILRISLPSDAEITVRYVGKSESQKLNLAHLNKDRPANVLTFPYPDQDHLCGDIAICPAVVAEEAEKCNIPIFERHAHLLVHAALHLGGMTHDDEKNAAIMERTENEKMSELGLPVPYTDRI